MTMALAVLCWCAVSWAAETTGPTQSGASPRPAARQANNLAILTIQGPIHAVTSQSIQRRIKLAEAQGADALVIELDTPGGEVGAVLEITQAIRSTSLYTIAWIHDDAISGGSIIAVACNEIVASPAATFGDSGIVRFGLPGSFEEGLAPTERAKIMSVIIAELVESARANGYDEVLIQSLAALRIETWQVRDNRTGQDYFLTEREYTALFGEAPTEGGQAKVGTAGAESLDDVTFYADAESERPPQPVDQAGFVAGDEDFSPGMMSKISAKVETRSTRPDFSRENPTNYTFIAQATDGSMFLTLTGASIADFGFSQATIANDEQLKQYTGAQQIARLNQSWSEDVVAFMTQPPTGYIVKGLLIVVFLLGLFIELSMPGVGVAGIIALCAFAGLVIPPLLVNASAWWTLVAVMAGVALILAEVFVVPGFGVPGVSGLVLLIIGLIGTFAPAGQLFPGQGNDDASLAWGASIVVLSIFAAGAGAYLVSRYTQHVPIANKLILSESQRASGDSATMLGAMASASESTGAAPVGATGVALTRLMPSGMAEIDGEVVDVVSDAGFIDQGEAIRVVSSASYRVAVERIPAPGRAQTGDERA